MQGIEEPIKAGDARDKIDKYMVGEKTRILIQT